MVHPRAQTLYKAGTPVPYPTPTSAAVNIAYNSSQMYPTFSGELLTAFPEPSYSGSYAWNLPLLPFNSWWWSAANVIDRGTQIRVPLVSKYNWSSGIIDTPESPPIRPRVDILLCSSSASLTLFPLNKGPPPNSCLRSASKFPTQDICLLDTISKSCCYSTDHSETFWYVYSLVQYQALGFNIQKEGGKCWLFLA